MKVNEKVEPKYKAVDHLITRNFYSPCECESKGGQFKERFTETYYEYVGENRQTPTGVTVMNNKGFIVVCEFCGLHEPGKFDAV